MKVHVLQLVFLTFSFWIIVHGSTIPEKLDYADHHCNRDCLMYNVTRSCEYNFTMEHYQTLSRACYDCPHNATDCNRPHCVAGDGRLRAIKVVNRIMPGPAINVCKGDTVLVNVYNQLGDFEGTAIHWHGILQEGSPHMDGVAMVTQCPIPAFSMFQYRFNAANVGTHYWHAHAGFQRGDGVFGSLVVRDVRRTNAMALYDHDLPEHTIIIQDWLDQYTSSKFSLHHHGSDDNAPVSILINGKSSSYGVEMMAMKHGSMEMPSPTMDDMAMGGTEESHNMDGHNSTEDESDKSHIPNSVFRVKRGSRYRFRVISNGVLNCPLKLSIHSHTLTIISTDGHDVDPSVVDSVTMFAGERFDFVLSANQDVGNYWIYVAGLGDCERKQTYETAILRYEGAMHMSPMAMKSYAMGTLQRMDLNTIKPAPQSMNVAEMTSPKGANDVYTSHAVKRFYFAMDFNRVENFRFLHKDFYSLDQMTGRHQGMHATHMYALQMNHITNAIPTSPLLTQYGDLTEDMFCNETSSSRDCTKDFCECVHRVKVQHNDIVEFVMVSEAQHGMGNHPMHLHGHAFYVLGMEKLNETITRRQVEIRDVQGKLKRNMDNPIKKDTVLVPDGGYTIIRFKASNLGFWLFHCHVEFHMSLGMSAVLQVGEFEEMTPLPGNFPRCGSWAYREGATAYGQCTSGSVTTSNLSSLIIIFSLVVATRLTQSLLN